MTKHVSIARTAEDRPEPTPAALVVVRRPRVAPPLSHARPPRPSWFAVERPRLVRRLSEAVQRAPVTLVRAPAGSGKTAALAAWASSRPGTEGPVAWMTLTERDDDPAVFWVHLDEALVAAGLPAASAEVPGAIPDAGDVDLLCTGLLELSTPAVIVLDRAERLRAPAVWERVRALLDAGGDGLRVVLSSRSEPPLPVHRLRVEGRSAELGPDDLALDPDEVAQVLGRHHVPTSDEVVATVLRRTEGWAAGVRLAALRLAEEGPDGDLDGFAAAYLRAEVLSTLTASAAEVLTATAVADLLPPGLAPALTGRADADAVVAAAAVDNTFVAPVAGHARTHRVHPLVRELLLADLDQAHPGRSAELHGRAAEWFDEHGDLEAAGRHGAAAGDWQATARRVVGGRGLADVITGTPTGRALAEDLAAIPEAGSPDVTVLRAAVALVDGDLDRARDRLDRAGGRAEVAASVVRTAWYDAAGRSADTLAAARAARSRLADAGVPDPFVAALVATIEGAAQLRAGDLAAASAVLDEAVSATTVADGPLRLRCLSELALAQACAGSLSRSLQLVDDAEREAAEQGVPATSRPMALELARVWVALERQELTLAGRSLNRISRARAAHADETCRTALLLLRARYLRDRGDLRGARQHLQQAGPAPAWLRHFLEAESGGLAAETRPSRAGAAPGVYRHVQELLDDADRRFRRGELPAARADVARALQLARADRLRRPFAHASSSVRSLISDDARTRAAAGWLGPDGSGAPEDGGAVPPAPVPEALSERELEVLRHLAAFLTTQEIAAEMFISVNTVRTHVRRVLEKLSVSRRHEAVRRGRELGLV
jgi:LuxR family maltose regulon positive regulatory protein